MDPQGAATGADIALQVLQDGRGEGSVLRAIAKQAVGLQPPVTEQLLSLAVAEGVVFAAGSPLYAQGTDRSALRVSCATNTPEGITEGLACLGWANQSYLSVRGIAPKLSRIDAP